MHSSARSAVRRANVTACLRCRSRKQRCDQQLPACSNCQRAGAECVSADLDGTPTPRSYMKQLEDKISTLERELQKQQQQKLSEMPSGSGSLGAGPPQSDTLQAYGVVHVTSVSDPCDCAVDELLGEARLQVPLPTGDGADALISIYFEHSDSFTPVLSRAKVQTALVNASSDDRENTVDATKDGAFTASMVFATAILLVNRKEASLPVSRADAHFLHARDIVSRNASMMHGCSVQAVQNMALMIQFLLLNAKLRPAWHLLGIATRLVVELNLQKSEAHDLTNDDGVDKCWLFWSIYSFERMLCAVLERPFSIPDEAITAPLPPTQDNAGRSAALQLILQRRLLSEICVTLMQNPCNNGALLDVAAWRVGMLQRIQASQVSAQPAGNAFDVVNGYGENLKILLLFPPNNEIILDADHIQILANAAEGVIQRYKVLFKEGQLRYYWRTLHHLHRAGSAMVYCLKILESTKSTELPPRRFLDSISICSAVLWGMAERYRPGAKYRDDFDSLSASLGETSETYALSPENEAVDFNLFLSLEQLENQDFNDVGGFE